MRETSGRCWKEGLFLARNVGAHARAARILPILPLLVSGAHALRRYRRTEAWLAFPSLRRRALRVSPRLPRHFERIPAISLFSSFPLLWTSLCAEADRASARRESLRSWRRRARRRGHPTFFATMSSAPASGRSRLTSGDPDADSPPRAAVLSRCDPPRPRADHRTLGRRLSGLHRHPRGFHPHASLGAERPSRVVVLLLNRRRTPPRTRAPLRGGITSDARAISTS